MLRELLPGISYTYGLEYNNHLTRSEETFVRFIRRKFSQLKNSTKVF